MHVRTPNASAILATAALTALLGDASAQAPVASLNLGIGLELRLENAHEFVDGRYIGTTKLVVNTLLETTFPGPYVVALEQTGRRIASGTCGSSSVAYSGDVVPFVRSLDECATGWVPAADVRTNAPVDVVITAVNEASDEQTEVYRGSYPVIGFWSFEGTSGDQLIHTEQRTLRVDSMYGVGFVRQYMGWDLQFTYVTTRDDTPYPRDAQFRCKVGEGSWTPYEISLSNGQMQIARNRVSTGDTIHEGTGETLITYYIRFTALRMPIGVEGGLRTPAPEAGLDGPWACELRYGDAGARTVEREFRFDVRGGRIQHHAIEGAATAGHGAALTSIGFNPTGAALLLDPSVVRTSLLGRPLRGETTPVLSGLPSRATTLAFTAPRASSGARRR